MIFELVGPGYIGRSSNIDASRLVNFFVEMNAKGSKSPFSLVGTPGTTLWTNAGAYVVRKMHVFNGLLYVVAGTNLYSVNTSGTVSAPLASLGTSIGRVIMKDNGLAVGGVGGNQLMIVDGVLGYIYNVVTYTFTSSAFFAGSGGYGTCGFPSTGVTALEFADGYFVVAQANSMNVFCSDLYNGLNWSTLAVASIEATPDPVQSIWYEQQQLFFVKQVTTEIWYNAGIATAQGFPFSRMTAAVMDYGTPAPASVARGNGGLFMLGARRVNDGPSFIGAVQISSDAVQVISPPAITFQMQKWTPWTDAFSYCYEADGHSFWVVTSPSMNQTFVFDSTIPDPMMAWHERSSYGAAYIYQTNRHLSNCYAYFNNMHLVGDWKSGNIYQMTDSVYQDDGGTPIVAFRTAQILADKKGELNSIRINRLIVDAEMGVGGNIVFSFSADGGHTWSGDYGTSLGAIGEYAKRAVWRRVGLFPYGMIARIMISDPCKRVIIGGYVD